MINAHNDGLDWLSGLDPSVWELVCFGYVEKEVRPWGHGHVLHLRPAHAHVSRLPASIQQSPNQSHNCG
jgi:hypothetical protein